MEKTPLTGNAVLTSAAIVTFTVTVIGLIRAYGGDVSPDQENAILEFLRGPAGELIVAAVLWITSYVARENVYSKLSVEKMTGRDTPPVVALTPEARMHPTT